MRSTGTIRRQPTKGGVWFARLDQVCDHVQRLVAEGRWTPHYETFPLYESPLHEFSKDR